MKKFMILLLTLTLTATVLAGCAGEKKEADNSGEEAEVTTGQEEEKSNLDKAKAVIESLASGDPQPITDYVSEDGYIQHNLAFADGRQTMLDALEPLKEAGTTVEIIRAFEDGDYVVLQNRYNLFGGGEQAGFDVFRFEDGLIVEHWDNLLEAAEPNPSGHTQFDGETEMTDQDKTEENKELVGSFVREILAGENPDALTDYFDGDNYIQHNPGIADGLSGLGEALEEMAANGIEMIYNQTHMILGNGNFVLAVSEGSFAGEPTSYYDLFRVEEGKIAEHWDVMETIAPVNEWQNDNGKYNAQLDGNKAKAVAVLTSLASGDPQPITDYVSEDGYVQHNLAFADGRQTMLDALEPLKEAGTAAEVVRVIAQDDYVGVQMKYNLFGAGEQAAIDIFRFEDGLIVEHWDNLQAVAEANPSGHTQFDGLFYIKDTAKTEQNKTLVTSFVNDILVGENPDALPDYFDGDNYIQHNTEIADGLSGLGEALEAMAANGIEMIYTDVKIVIAEGNFVLAASEGTFGGEETAFFDLFRVEDGKIAEHWDVIETIADEADWANTNGKF